MVQNSKILSIRIFETRFPVLIMATKVVERWQKPSAKTLINPIFLFLFLKKKSSHLPKELSFAFSKKSFLIPPNYFHIPKIPTVPRKMSDNFLEKLKISIFFSKLRSHPSKWFLYTKDPYCPSQNARDNLEKFMNWLT